MYVYVLSMSQFVEHCKDIKYLYCLAKNNSTEKPLHGDQFLIADDHYLTPHAVNSVMVVNVAALK